jgi:Rrf2 family protein
MKLLSRNADYAVRALCYIAAKNGGLKKHKQIVSVTELVKELKIPRPFLRKILQALSKNKILESTKGVGGGFVLARNPGRIYLLDVIEAFQGPFGLKECFFKKELCPDRERCCLREKIKGIEDSVYGQLKGVNIESIMKGG